MQQPVAVPVPDQADEIPADVKKKLTFKTVKNIDQALRYALKLSEEK